MNNLNQINLTDFIVKALMDGGKVLFVMQTKSIQLNLDQKKMIRKEFLSMYTYLKINGKSPKNLKSIKRIYADTTEKIKIHRFDRGLILPGADVSAEVIAAALERCNGNFFRTQSRTK